MITRHGVWHVLTAGAGAGVLSAGALWLAVSAGWAWGLLALLPMIVFGWVVWFFRDPPRRSTGGEESVIASADGRVTDVTPLGPDSELGCEGLRIGVFMSIFSVHVNRMPCTGQIEDITHRPGAYLDVRDPAAAERNESTAIRLGHERGGRRFPVVVRQIAGLIARRIVTTVSVGDRVERGERIGMIRFGSRVEVSLPLELVQEVRVEVGQQVRAGKTVLAIFKERP